MTLRTKNGKERLLSFEEFFFYFELPCIYKFSALLITEAVNGT